mmetsp:Transcript_21151/g.51761  ORF Transcript_21151/g.51761 Transcript_21151/m.51761 type:complete len:247 (-) Transcript_21151:888-1628(-)
MQLAVNHYKYIYVHVRTRLICAYAMCQSECNNEEGYTAAALETCNWVIFRVDFEFPIENRNPTKSRDDEYFKIPKKLLIVGDDAGHYLKRVLHVSQISVFVISMVGFRKTESANLEIKPFPLHCTDKWKASSDRVRLCLPFYALGSVTDCREAVAFHVACNTFHMPCLIKSSTPLKLKFPPLDIDFLAFKDITAHRPSFRKLFDVVIHVLDPGFEFVVDLLYIIEWRKPDVTADHTVGWNLVEGVL